MAQISSFPHGFQGGISIRNVPLVVAHPGSVFWVSNNAALATNQRGGSDGNDGTFNSPFATLDYAIGRCVAGRGDIIMVKPGHAESLSAASAITSDVSGVAIVGLGSGDMRATFTWDTANTASWVVSAASCSFYNLLFKANFLSIATAFSLSTAKAAHFSFCEFQDTSNVLNFLCWIKSTGAANTVDGLTFNDNRVYGLGTTSVTSTIVTANDIDRLTMQRNFMKLGLTNDKAIALTVTAGVLTSLLYTDNIGYRLNTTTAGGGTINVGGTTSTGVVARNFQQTATTTTDLLFTTTVGLGAFENRVSGAVGAQGFVIPAADS